MSVTPPACPPVRCHYSTAELLFVKFYIRGFHHHLSRISKFLLKSGNSDYMKTYVHSWSVDEFLFSIGGEKNSTKKSNTEQPDRQRWSNTLGRQRMYTAYPVARTVIIFTVPVHVLVLMEKVKLAGTLSLKCGTYRVIHKSLRDFRTRLRNNQDRHGRKEHINR